MPSRRRSRSACRAFSASIWKARSCRRPKKGIHDAAKFRTPDAADVALIADSNAGRTLLTIAPEEVTPDIVRELARTRRDRRSGPHQRDVRTDARRARRRLRGFTHLYNAMSPLQSREPGAVGAALDDAESWCGIIVDGHHVHAAALRVALRAKPRGKVFLVTDAMPPVGSDDPTFRLNGETITCSDGKCTNEAGTLAGSALDMAAAVRNTVAMLGVDLAEALRMASQYPAAFIGLQDTHGRIAAGFRGRSGRAPGRHRRRRPGAPAGTSAPLTVRESSIG